MDTVSSSHIIRTCRQARHALRAARGASWLVQSFVALVFVFAVNGAYAQTFPGSVANTVRITLPSNTTDPTPGDTATDTNTLAVSDLSITKTLTSTSPALPGSTVTYQIVVTNAGPSPAQGATVTDTVPTELANVSWTCSAAGTSSCATAGGTGNISVAMDIGVGAANAATITVTGTAPLSGTIGANTATVVAPPGTDPVPGDNTDTVDPVPVSAVSDLTLVKTLTSASPAAAGSTVSYQIVVSNAGPSDAIGATITDTVPTQLGNVSWTCVGAGASSCGAPNGTGDVSLTANIAAGAGNTITITVTGTAPASGTIDANTATVTPPVGTTDPVPGDNTDTVDPVPVALVSDLSVVKTLTSASPAAAGSAVTYQVIVSNAGPSDAIGATITDTVPTQLGNVSWTCLAAGTSTCGTPNGIGDVSLTANIAAGAGNTITIVVTGTAPASGTIGANTATVTPPGGTTDPVPGDNTDTVDPVPVTPTVSINSASVAEGDSVVFTVSLSGPSATDVSVTLNTANGTAIAPGDYIAQSGLTVTILAGNTTATVSVPTIEDTLFEGDETFTATISNPVGATIGTATGTGTITDNDTQPAVSIDSASAAEGDAVVFTVSLSNPSTSDVTVTLNTADVTAIAGTDYTAQSGITVTIPAGATSVTVNVTTTEDTLFEGNETFTATISNPTGATLGTATGTGTITDDETAPVVSIDSPSAAEGDTMVFTVSLSNPSATDVTVVLDTSNGTATAPADYTAQSGITVTIPAGATSVTVNVTTTEDTLFEGNETFTATISNPTGATLGTAIGTGTITDNEAAPVASISGGTATEGSAVVFTVSLSGASASDVTMLLDTSNGTAVAPADYAAQTALLVTIPAGSTSATASVPTIDDAVFEGDETFTATISNPVGATIGTAAATGTITENDAAPTLSINDITVNEAAGTATFTVTLSAASATTVTVDYASAPGTATSPADFTAVSGNLVFAPGVLTQTISVAIADDNIDEADETFTLVLSNAVSAAITDNSGLGTIVDNEGTPTVSIDSPSVAEGDVLVFTISLSNPSATDVTVTLDTANGTAVAPGDYTAQSGLAVTVPAGATSVTVNVPTIEDTLFEGNETFTATISNPTGATLGTATGTGTITDDETAPTLSINDVTVSESAGTATFTVTLSAASATALTVDFATANGSAIAGSDYTATSGTLTFAPGVLTQTIVVPITNDALSEGSETFTVNLTNATVATIADNNGLGTITDDETAPVVSIDSPSAAEGDTMVFTVSLSAASATDVTVVLNTANGTATAPADYTAQSAMTVTLPAGATTATVNVPTIEDTLFEGNETFTATISAPTGATIGTPTGTATITEDDAVPTISIADATVTEGAIAQLIVSLSSPSATAVTVVLNTSNGTATAPADYTAQSGVIVTIPAGQVSVTVPIATAADALFEGDETFNVTLATPNGATLGDATATVTITDDETAPTLSINDVTVDESVGIATFTVTLSGPSATTVTVDYATANGTATAGSDYTSTNGTLSFAPGTLTQTIPVPITDDSTDEPNETYSVALSNAAAATIADATGLGTITDNDVRVIDAVADTAGPVPGTGGPNVVNVLTNDTLDGAPVNPAVVVFTPTSNGPLTINPDGSVDVAPNTPAGTYTASYQICESANPGNCDTATVTVTVGAGVIVANDDTAGPVTGSTGASNVVNVLANDTLNGAPVDPAGVVFTPTSSGPLTINTDGSVDVAPNTPAGTYTATYQICEALNPANCESASVTVTVSAASIVANDDTGSVASGAAGGTAVANVLANDTVGSATATVSGVVLTQQSSSHANVVLDTASGAVTVAAGTPVGTYTLTYRICEALNPANCDTATVTVTVAAAVIIANDDTAGPVPGSGGTNVVNVLSNDTLSGSPVVLADVVLTPTSSSPLTINPDGSVDVAPNTPARTYTATYQICERLNPANCDTASVTITVAAAVIVANDDSAGPVPGSTGGTNVANVLANDTLGGAPIVLANVMFTPTGSSPLTLNPDGSVDVAPNTPAGTYTATYQICERLNPANCDSATVTITVAAAPIDAIDDDATATPISGSNGGMALGSVLPNDTLDGAATNTSNVVTSFVSCTHPGITLNATEVRVAPNTPAGTYTLTYRICEVLNPANCDTAVVSLVVAAAVIDAIDDTASVDGVSGGNAVIDVLGNDRVDGAAVNTAAITLTSTPTGPLTINPNGTLDVAPNTPAGTYTITYQICENLNPANCDTATVTVTVTGETAALRITKRAMQRTVKVGELVRYTITADNVSAVNAIAVNLVDAIPAGFGYVDGSLSVDDDDNGGNLAGTSPLTVAGIDLAPGHQATITYYLRVGAGVGPGIHTNRAVMQNASGQAVSNVATADVEVAGDPLFDDSLILGTVFDDRNGNGIQEAGERGVPGVRIASIEGLIAETDSFGRYHLVGIPAGSFSRGRLFILKVDPATLPAGTTFITENPRVRRITPGLPVRFDFGVKLPEAVMEGGSKQVDIELGEVIFARNSAEIPAGSGEMLDRIADTVRKHGGGRVSIVARGAAETLAFQRAQAVQAEVGRRLGSEIADKTRIDVTTEVEPLVPLISLDRAIGLSRLLFDTDKADIRPQYGDLIRHIAQAINERGHGELQINGHADARGDDAHNMDLSMRRARAVFDAIARELRPEVRERLRVDITTPNGAVAGAGSR